METKSQSPTLRIRALKVEGKYHLNLRLDPNQRVFVLQGENSSGKSTLMNLFYFGLGGGTKGDFIPELEHCSHLLLEVSIAGEILTFKRSFNSKPSLIAVYPTGIDQIDEENAVLLTTDAKASANLFQDFIMDRLTLKDRPVTSKKTGKLSRLSWSQLLGLVYVDQETPAKALYRGAEFDQRETKTKRLEVVFDFNREQLDELEHQLTVMQQDQAEKEAQFKGIIRILSDLNLTEDGLIGLAEQIREHEQRRAEVHAAISSIKSTMRTSSTHLDAVRFEISALSDHLRATEEALLVAVNRTQDYRRLLNDIDVERERIIAHEIVEDTTNGLHFSTCPSCLQSLTDTAILPGTCPVCHQPAEAVALHAHGHKPYLDVLADKQKDITEALSNAAIEIDELTQRRHTTVEAKRQRERVLNEQTANMVAPFLSELENLYESLQALDRAGEALEAKLRAYKQLKAYRTEIDDLDFQISETRDKLKYLKELVEAQVRIYTSVMNETLRDYRQGGILPQAISFELDPASLLPLVNGKSIDALKSASDKVVARLGFFYGVLAVATRTDARHPKLLLLDSPRDKDMDLEKFEAIADKYISLVQSSSADCQLVITTSHATPAMKPFVFLRTEDSDGHRLLSGSV